jgi:RNA polymerase sigma factor (sigma-70 family)
MEVNSLTQAALPARSASVRLLRLASDERLIGLTRRGHHAAFEALVQRYEQRLLSFCRHMLGSREDAEDILQDVFVAAFNAMLADERKINVRPWLYRIARNRCLNHLRRASPVGVDSMDTYFADHGQSVTERILQRERFQALVQDIGMLAETQRTALLLREIDALSYEQIAEVMETTVPSVKSLLVRARVALAEAAEARQLSCQEVRLELAEAAEGLLKTSSPVRRHVRGCERCSAFRKQLKRDDRVLAALLPVGLPALVHRLLLTKLGSTTSAGGAYAASGGGLSASAGTSASVGASAGVAAGTGAGALGTIGGIAGLGTGAVATKAIAGLTAAALLTAGAVAAENAAHPPARPATTSSPAGNASAAPPQGSAAPAVVVSGNQPTISVPTLGTGAAGKADATARAAHRARQHATGSKSGHSAAAASAAHGTRAGSGHPGAKAGAATTPPANAASAGGATRLGAASAARTTSPGHRGARHPKGSGAPRAERATAQPIKGEAVASDSRAQAATAAGDGASETAPAASTATSAAGAPEAAVPAPPRQEAAPQAAQGPTGTAPGGGTEAPPADAG